MVTLAVRIGFTVIVITFEVSGLPVTHDAFEVMMQEMVFPFASDEVV